MNQGTREGVPEDPALRQWMAEYQAGRIDAFNRLHDALAPDLRAFLDRRTRDATQADDLLQETFLQLHRARASHAPGAPVRPWAFAIARRVFLMDRRGAARRVRHEQGAVAEAGERVTVNDAERIHAGLEVEAVLRRVPEQGGLAFVMHHLLGWSFKDVGAELGITPATAKVKSSRAASLMRALLRGRRDE